MMVAVSSEPNIPFIALPPASITTAICATIQSTSEQTANRYRQVGL